MKKLFIPACLALFSMALHAQQKELPPPPPPPKPPKVETVRFAPPVIVADNDDFYTRNPNVSSIQVQNSDETVVTLKDKSVEHYKLKTAEGKKAFTDKYGALPAAPPPPPPPVKRSGKKGVKGFAPPKIVKDPQ